MVLGIGMCSALPIPSTMVGIGRHYDKALPHGARNWPWSALSSVSSPWC